ncbi:hypothetical protein O2K51_09530 [Apibacter raozihei]|uniref:hypothetical protein n=1 Tax=Apibacter raozihei TaxID=2500547 RepID=UPI000FE2A1CC|nr:hypothetical protein [Apibacter raozihei]
MFISKGKSYNEIKEKENSLAIIFSEDIIEFFSTISKFQFEGISIHFDELAPLNKEQLNLLILGEFWLYGDGDKIVYNSEDHKVYSFAHEYRPPQLIKIADSLK